MNNELIRTQLETGLAFNSLKSLVKATTEVVMLLVDCSGSMESRMQNGKSRIEGLRDSYRDIVATGHVPTIAFGGPYDAQVRFVDRIPDPDGGTPLHLAIPFAKTYGATRLVVISDGCPDLPDQCRIAAKDFNGQIDVVFVGEPGEAGSFFLDELAKLTGGKRFEGDLSTTKMITGMVIGLLDGECEPAHAPIQGPGFTAAASDAMDTDPEPESDEEEEDDDDNEDDDDA